MWAFSLRTRQESSEKATSSIQCIESIISLNQELTEFHEEILDNLNCIHGTLLRMNRSIQADGAFGGIKWNRSYTRAKRRGLEGLLLETALISCGFNLRKFHLKAQAKLLTA